MDGTLTEGRDYPVFHPVSFLFLHWERKEGAREGLIDFIPGCFHEIQAERGTEVGGLVQLLSWPV